MLHPRIIPCLLVQNNGLVKTVQFKQGKYVGDPINAVKIFNEKEVDELILLDIDATRLNREPNYKRIKNLALECCMPLCYGGGIKTNEQAIKILGLGVEKIAISSIALEKPEIISEIAVSVGNQSVIVVLDVKKNRFSSRYSLYTHNGTKKIGVDPVEFAKKAEALGCGEIMVNSIDRDGVMKGYDFDIINNFREAVSIPLTVLGGAGSLDDIGQLIKEHGIIGAAAGSIFVFKGKYKAVLINYPNRLEKENLITRYFNR